MKRSYKWGWQIDDTFQAITPYLMTKEENEKNWYVNQFLDPSVKEAKCGWHGIAYVVGTYCDGEDRREYVLMFGSANDTPRAARWIDVTGDSKGAIAEAVWSLVFA